jgi:VIT1/CCC1 family predicted Fe2+/Mn2+ transporter
MKKSMLRLCMIALVAIGFGTISEGNASEIEKMNKKELQALDENESKERLEVIEVRLKEIQEMDVKSLPRAERKEITKELREIKKQHDFLSDGVYLSVGAIIIILLVLILLT